METKMLKVKYICWVSVCEDIPQIIQCERSTGCGRRRRNATRARRCQGGEKKPKKGLDVKDAGERMDGETNGMQVSRLFRRRCSLSRVQRGGNFERGFPQTWQLRASVANTSRLVAFTRELAWTNCETDFCRPEDAELDWCRYQPTVAPLTARGRRSPGPGENRRFDYRWRRQRRRRRPPPATSREGQGQWSSCRRWPSTGRGRPVPWVSVCVFVFCWIAVFSRIRADLRVLLMENLRRKMTF